MKNHYCGKRAATHNENSWNKENPTMKDKRKDILNKIDGKKKNEHQKAQKYEKSETAWILPQ